MSIKCDYCGKFIAYDDIDAGDAFVTVEPSSDLGVEKIERTCKQCVLPPKKLVTLAERTSATMPPARGFGGLAI